MQLAEVESFRKHFEVLSFENEVLGLGHDSRSRTALFFYLLKMCQGLDLFFLRVKFREKLAIFCAMTFIFFIFLENTCALCPSALTLDFFVPLASSFVSSTPPLAIRRVASHVTLAT